ncbi:hypothetical protein [Phenylobacterium soli]|uniref:Uncharacterized protein n=1 Tax=Phenylobacterium soli TaxID=2170551 RepID=A0A328A974_9CAUL|nr:hypothetical protein [Phenylobacterium soli]RAK51202.1 hypothetical protein DJ017_19790 [Phenylobacterium soli]
MTAINGHAPSRPLANPALDIAERLYTSGIEEGDALWSDLTDEEREALIEFAAEHIAAHAQWLRDNGFRIIPTDAVPVPASEAEAFAMLKAAKGYFDASKRKGQLMGSAPKKLIIPGKLN